MPSEQRLTGRRIFATWWPLAASWELMALELPMVSGVVARLADPAIHLAAYGGVVFPLALIIESPVIMLLAASTALSRDFATFAKVRRYMYVASAALTTLHVLVAFTPLFDFIVEHILGTPPLIREPARLGLQLMTPWTGAIAYRRFHQGVLIRFGHTRAVGLGTVIRLCTNVSILALGFHAELPGIVVAASAVASGVVSEALYTAWRVRPVLVDLRKQPPRESQITLGSFLRFYTPLAMTSLMMLLMEPIGAAALGRMPQALACLAVWPVLFGLVWMSEALGEGYQEVVLALIERPRGYLALRRFARVLALTTVIPLVIIAAVPAMATAWFEGVTALPPELARLARVSLWFALPMPVMAVLRSLFQGVLVHHHETRGIPESVALFLGAAVVLSFIGIVVGDVAGLYVVVPAMSTGMAAQAAWLAVRSRRLRAQMR